MSKNRNNLEDWLAEALNGLINDVLAESDIEAVRQNFAFKQALNMLAFYNKEIGTTRNPSAEEKPS